jgi:DNA-binding NarL/FixJ family response regulator
MLHSASTFIGMCNRVCVHGGYRTIVLSSPKRMAKGLRLSQIDASRSLLLFGGPRSNSNTLTRARRLPSRKQKYRYIEMITHSSGRESNSHPQAYGENLEPALLTPREVHVARLLAQGYMVENVAANLIISPHTVESHRRSIYGKLRVANRSELTLQAIQIGIIDCPCQSHLNLRRAA